MYEYRVWHKTLDGLCDYDLVKTSELNYFKAEEIFKTKNNYIKIYGIELINKPNAKQEVKMATQIKVVEFQESEELPIKYKVYINGSYEDYFDNKEEAINFAEEIKRRIESGYPREVEILTLNC